MQHGEWWLDESGQSTFADGDVGDSNHEGEAFQAALGINFEEMMGDSDVPDMIPGDPLSKEAIEYLKAQGVSKKTIDYFKKGADARNYALEFMGWTRVKGANIETWKLDETSFENIKNADFWDEEDEDSDEEVFIEELSTGKSWSVPMKVLSKAQNVKGLLAIVESDVRKWHAMEGMRKKKYFGRKPRMYKIEKGKDQIGPFFVAIWYNDRGEYVETIYRGRTEQSARSAAEHQGFIPEGDLTQ